MDSMIEKGVKVIDFTFYYPYHFENPYAAYLIPSDLKVGEKVFIEDLIEDIVGSTWNQGDSYRLGSAEGVWDGKTLDPAIQNGSTIVFMG